MHRPITAREGGGRRPTARGCVAYLALIAAGLLVASVPVLAAAFVAGALAVSGLRVVRRVRGPGARDRGRTRQPRPGRYLRALAARLRPATDDSGDLR